MKFLLLVAHGSRLSQSNSEVEQVAARLSRVSHGQFDGVLHAFLELAEPSIPEGIDACVAAGADEVTILPYFLAAGRHVQEDIPEIISAKQAEYPQCTLRIAPYLGTATELPELLLALSRQ